MYKGCDFYSMMEDYYKPHPEEAKEMGLKIYSNDGVIDEMPEVEAYDTGTMRVNVFKGGEQGVKKKKRRKRKC